MSKVRALWQASLTATKRALTWNIEDMIPPSERFIYNFNSKEELKKWHLYSDSEYGGLSSAALEINDAGNERSGPGVFSGNLSLDVTEGTKWNISRSGFCGMRSKKVDISSVVFDGFIDLDPYDTIALKVKGDGRSYISTIYTENWVNSPGQMEDNSWQAFVCVPKDNWVVAKANIEMNPSKVVGMSLSVNAEGGVPDTETGPGFLSASKSSSRGLCPVLTVYAAAAPAAEVSVFAAARSVLPKTLVKNMMPDKCTA
ncbi:Galactose-binding domain-like protein [Cynara cardunculus var. scolymus]|uniref:Galactose-binding domain-like protein n=1 Tax=Cynara cardunculus var. scolymus TaxID=59895 RepID=A0A103YC13_CYNCS|nr:Galactose-binding domain-like protein [Cynara cardunculus var. scolymus]